LDRVKDLGEPSWVLGIRIRRDADGNYLLNQSSLIERLVSDFVRDGKKHCNLPMDPRQGLCSASHGDMGNEIDSTLYRQMIGGAMYLMTGTRPDISFALSALSRHVNKPHEQHRNAAINLIRYLNKTKNLELRLGNGVKGNALKLSCYVDASFGSDLDTRRSITGFVIFVNGSAVFWKSKRQSLVTLSSAEAEYVALSSAMRELLVIKNLIDELPAIQVDGEIKVHEDNQAVIKMVSSAWTTTRSRHIGIHYHFVRERFTTKEFQILFVKTSAQLADGLTKAATLQVLMKLIESCFVKATSE
jgi:ribonuclease HI